MNEFKTNFSFWNKTKSKMKVFNKIQCLILTVSHNILMNKLKKCEIGCELDWELTDWKSLECYDSSIESIWRPVSSDVPQLLDRTQYQVFIIFIRELHQEIEYPFSQSADDTKLGGISSMPVLPFSKTLIDWRVGQISFFGDNQNLPGCYSVILSLYH